ncbi:MAG: M20/M25/M40 family metallo-hydrolase, partial [Candidatus Promineifilaceae bacterium]|nr:M20/M25/M40 family metallo-hydrolase [Candidatus Promineifilaceae bacterium]
MTMDAVRLLEQIVAIPSPSGEEEAVARRLVSCMSDLGLKACVDGAGNAVGRRVFPAEDGVVRQTVVLLGHMDTVPGEIPVRIEQGVLYGRGTVDAKGPLAAFVMAAAQARLAPGTQLVVIGAVEEEAA